MELECIVYVHIDENKNVVSIISSCEEMKDDGFIEVDRGKELRHQFAHAYYLTKGLTDSNGVYNYKLVNNKVETRTDEDKHRDIRHSQIYCQMLDLKTKLVETDYVVIKIAEGVSSKDEYSGLLAARDEWRKQLNRLEVEYDEYKG